MRVGIEIQERPRGDKIFATALASGKEKRDVSNLLGENIDRPIDPDRLLVRVRHYRAGVVIGVTA